METDPESGKEINLHRDVENLGYVFNIGKTKIFHGGDSNPADSSEFVSFALQNEHIDIAFLDRLFLFRGETAQAIMEHYIRSNHTVFMHISPANAARLAPVFMEDSTATVFKAPLEHIELNF
jgi:L-ascorbate metabolism protein UlaG (beta-lactamase superfamily)